jgi:hypothetical protein
VVRVDCDTKGVKYVCKDDLVNEKGIQKRFFDAKQIKKTEACLKSLHGVRTVDQIKPDAIVDMGGPPVDYLDKMKKDLTQ